MAALTWTTACPDWEDRIVKGQSLITAPVLFPDVADEAWDIIGSLKLADVGHALMADVSRQWLIDLVKVIFGSENPETGRRLINEVFICVSKKNAKSSIAAAIMLCALLMNWRPSAELLILSPTKEVADNSFKPIFDFIEADEELKAVLEVKDYRRLVTHKETGATLKVVAADSDAVSGKKASFVFVDEIHEFGKKPKASNMLLEATGGLASRPEGFVIYATTQSAEPPAGVFKQKLQYARNVRDGLIEDKKFLPLIYEFPKAMLERNEHLDLSNAYVTNPNWGASVDIERITQLYNQYKDGGENEFKEFLAKHLNVEIGMNLSNDRWPGADFWKQQERKHITFEYLMEHAEVITAGIDGGGLDDLLGLAFIGRHKTTGEWMGWVHAWAHPSVLERRKEIAPRLRDFANDGDLTIIENMGEDVTELSDLVAHVHQLGLLDKVGADPAGIAAILDALEARGIPSEKLVGVSQGWLLIGSVKAVERRLASPQPNQSFVHADQPLMDWCVSNAKVVVSKAGYNISKAVSGTGKIDPVMALIDAAHLMALNPAAARSINSFLSRPLKA